MCRATRYFYARPHRRRLDSYVIAMISHCGWGLVANACAFEAVLVCHLSVCARTRVPSLYGRSVHRVRKVCTMWKAVCIVCPREEREKSERRTREEREMAGFPAPKRYSWKRKIGRVDTAFIFYSRSRVSLVVVRYRATSSIVRPMRTRWDYFRNATPGYFNFSERSIWVAALVRWKSTPCFYRLRLSNPTPRHLAITFAAFCPCSIWQLVPQENATSSTKRLSVRNFFFILSPFSLHSLSIISLDRFESNGHRTRLR